MQSADIVPAPVYRFKLTDYDDGVGEVSFWYDEPIGREARREAVLYPAPRVRSSEPKQENVERAVRRAGSKVRKLVMTMRADRLLTLTTREAIMDRKAFSALWVRFVKEVHKVYPKWQYVCVLEKHDSEKTSDYKRGSYHCHASVSGWQDVGTLRKIWRKLTDGTIHVTPPRDHGQKRSTSASIAGYLKKYLTKTFADSQCGAHRYTAAATIELRQLSGWFGAPTFADAVEEAYKLLHGLFGQVGTVYLDDNYANGWFASWSLDFRQAKPALPA